MRPDQSRQSTYLLCSLSKKKKTANQKHLTLAFNVFWNLDSGIREISACGIRNPAESGILGIHTIVQGIRNRTCHWNPESKVTLTKSGIQYLQAGKKN